MYAATREAVERAASGEGPTLIEAVCYRFGAHATADDARLYRHPDEEAEWLPRDPVDPLRRLPAGRRGLWDDDREAGAVAEAEADFDRAMAAIEARPLPGRDDIIRHASARVPARLVEQLNRLEEFRGEEPSSSPTSETAARRGLRSPMGPTERWTMAEALNAAMRRGDGARDRRPCCSARTSGSPEASSASPRASRSGSARTG